MSDQVSAAYSGQADVYPPSADFRKRAWISSREQYDALYRRSIADPEGFWKEQAARIDWFRPFHTVRNVSWASDDLYIRWYEGGTLNACYNCVDRHLAEHGDRAALLFEPDDPNAAPRAISWRELHHEVCIFANVLKRVGVRKGDRVTIYLPMIPEAAYAMLACARIGAVHSVVFAGFSPDSLADRILDCDSKVLVTADEGVRGGKRVPLKQNADKALERCPDVASVVVVERTGSDVPMAEGRDHWYREARKQVDARCDPEEMDAEDPLFILYTSGSTGKPKGVLHTTGGYLTYASLTHQYVFDCHEDDIFWCTADVGWITGHTYMAYGPLLNAVTQVFFEGTPTWPSPSRFWDVADRHGVTIFYTAPTAIRALMREGDEYVTRTDRRSLRVLGTVGEPINPEAWKWYRDVVGAGRCPVVDTWWQTETGGIMIAPLPGAIDQKPGSATLPFFGVRPELLDPEGAVLEGPGAGLLAIAGSWPGQMRTVYRNHDRFVQTYFSRFEGKYFTGDGCRRDEDGYYWITGRVDDVLNVSGHRMGTAEIESALVSHGEVAEAAVVGFPHEIKGQGVYGFVTLVAGVAAGEDLRAELVQHVRRQIGPIARPDCIQFAPALPKTRSGKIMRRILRKIAANEYQDLGDTSTLADPGVVEDLVASRQNR